MTGPTHAVTGSARTLRVDLDGDLTAPSVPGLRARLRREMQPDTEAIEFDFARTVALDSSGLALLLACHNSLSGRHGRLSLVNVSEDLAQLLQSLRLAQCFTVGGRSGS